MSQLPRTSLRSRGCDGPARGRLQLFLRHAGWFAGWNLCPRPIPGGYERAGVLLSVGYAGRTRVPLPEFYSCEKRIGSTGQSLSGVLDAILLLGALFRHRRNTKAAN